MEQNQKSLKAVNTALWVVQVLLAVGFIMGGIMKIFIPVEKLAVMWPWAAEVPFALLKFTGFIDTLAAMGILLPSIFKIMPRLVPVTAFCIIILMVSAAIFHVARGEANSIGVNIVFVFMAAFVAWGRFKKQSTI